MINKIVVLDNDDKYLIILNEKINNNSFLVGVKIVNEKYTNDFKLFLEKKKDNDIFLEEIEDEDLLKVIVNSFLLKNID